MCRHLHSKDFLSVHFIAQFPVETLLKKYYCCDICILNAVDSSYRSAEFDNSDDKQFTDEFDFEKEAKGHKRQNSRAGNRANPPT